MADLTDLFMSLFHGRTDAYGLVEGKAVKEPVTRELYQAHLDGKRSLGIYPLLDDGTCFFAAIDLDEKNWDQALTIRNELLNMNVRAYICESKSKGYHIYLFSDGPMVAKDVRYMLLGLLDKLKITAEVFPKQDKLDDVITLGNYINLCAYGNTRQFQSGSHESVPTPQALKLIQKMLPEVIIQAKTKVPPPAPIMLPIKPTKPKEKESRKTKIQSPPCVDRLLKGVESGIRDEAAFALARHFLDQGDVPEETLARLLIWDARNKPPIADMRVLQTKVQSAEHGYAFGCNSITSGLLSGACVGKEKCEYLKKAIELKKKEGLIRTTTIFEDEDKLYEEVILNPTDMNKAKSLFMVYDFKTGAVSEAKEIQSGDITYIPTYDKTISDELVILPTGVEEYGTTEKLMREIEAYIYHYADFSKEFQEWASWWVLMTWVYDRLPSVSYLRFLGDWGCITGDSKVALASGAMKSIQDFGTEHLQSIKANLRLKGQHGALAAQANVFHKYMNADIFQMVTETGKKLSGTSNHKVMVKRVRDCKVISEWVRLDELVVGDKIRVATKIECQIRRMTCGMEYASLIGYMLGDGGVRKDRNSIDLYISDSEVELLPKLKTFISKTLGIEPNQYLRKAHGENRTVDMHILEASGLSVSSLTREKHVPEEIWQANNQEVGTFLSWLFTADGSVFCGGRGHSGISLSQRNVELLRDVQQLLLRFGIQSRIQEITRENGMEALLFIRKVDSIIKFSKNVGFQTNLKIAKLQELTAYAEALPRNVSSSPWEKVTSIGPAGTATVYDLEVPTYHRYIANGIVVHNTGKSRALDTVGGICYKRTKISGAVTAAAIYRVLDIYRGTLVIDENDMDNDSELTGIVTKILNSGIERGTPIIRCQKEGEDDFGIQTFRVFGPKLFATRRNFEDMALESRCLTTKMQETNRPINSRETNAIPFTTYSRECLATQEHLRNKLLLFRFRHLSHVPKILGENDCLDMDIGKISGRLKQVCLPFATIFRDNPETMDKFRRFLERYQKEIYGETSDSYQGRVAAAMFRAALLGKDKITCVDVAREAKEEGIVGRGGIDVSPQHISKILRGMGVNIKSPQHADIVEDGIFKRKTKRYIEWDAEKMQALYSRYYPGFGKEDMEKLELRSEGPIL